MTFHQLFKALKMTYISGLWATVKSPNELLNTKPDRGNCMENRNI